MFTTSNEINAIIAEFEDALLRFPELYFEFDLLNRTFSFSGCEDSLERLCTLAKKGVPFLPRTYLDDLRPIPVSWPPEAIWCLGVISAFWYLGTGKPGLPIIEVELEDGECFRIPPTQLLSPFRFDIDPVQRVHEAVQNGGKTVQKYELRNRIAVFRDSIEAGEHLLMRSQLSKEVDRLFPTYIDAVRLTADIDDLIAVAEKFGKSVKEDSCRTQAVFAISGRTIPMRFRIWNSNKKIKEFNPSPIGWSYRATSALSQVCDLFREYHQMLSWQFYDSIPSEIDFSCIPEIPTAIISRFKEVNTDIKQELARLQEDRNLIPDLPSRPLIENSKTFEQSLKTFFNVAPSNEEGTIAFRNQKHDDLCNKLSALIHDFQFDNPFFVQVIQCLQDSGVDLLIALVDEKLKMGIQLKSDYDVSEKDFLKKTMAQIQSSRSHGIEKLFIVLACDITRKDRRERVRTLISRVSQQNDPYVETIPPEVARTVFF